ncbi:MAG: protein translocase subunit SecF [Gammaproteobacteria bacterium]|nr:MAG: protein translocase subunit SecF [Gammaproteobacteria bacterium]
MSEFDFMSKRKIAAVCSALLVVASIVSLGVRQLNFGLDFSGGMLIEVGYKAPVELEPIRAGLKQSGFDSAVVQHFGESTEVLVRLPPTDIALPKLEKDMVEVLKRVNGGEVDIRRIEFVGPQVGDELRDQSGIAMIVALFFMMVYVAFRFQFKFGVGATTALFHDVVITLGLFSIFQLSFDLTVLAAILAVIGYSLNDTIVVSDRIRENFKKLRLDTPEEIINVSLNQTLGRTVVTSFTTILVLLALLLVGPELIRGFAIALLIGVLVGTYSSIYVASNVLLNMGISKEDFFDVKPDDVDGMP